MAETPAPVPAGRGPFMRYLCPISGCEWHHDEPNLPRPPWPWMGSIEDSIFAGLTDRAQAVDRTISDHVATHSVLEWFTEVRNQQNRTNQAETERDDAQRRFDALVTSDKAKQGAADWMLNRLHNDRLIDDATYTSLCGLLRDQIDATRNLTHSEDWGPLTDRLRSALQRAKAAETERDQARAELDEQREAREQALAELVELRERLAVQLDGVGDRVASSEAAQGAEQDAVVARAQAGTYHVAAWMLRNPDATWSTVLERAADEPNADLECLAAMQGVQPATSIDQLTAPEAERVSDKEWMAYAEAVGIEHGDEQGEREGRDDD